MSSLHVAVYPLNGRGLSLHPYRPHLIYSEREETKPQELRLPPDDVYASEELKDLTECLSLRSWVQDWLAFLRWYCILALSEKVSLAEFFNSPVVNTSWVLEGHSERYQSCPFWSPLEVLRLGRGYRLKSANLGISTNP